MFQEGDEKVPLLFDRVLCDVPCRSVYRLLDKKKNFSVPCA